jgi:hypothetical protein
MRLGNPCGQNRYPVEEYATIESACITLVQKGQTRNLREADPSDGITTISRGWDHGYRAIHVLHLVELNIRE